MSVEKVIDLDAIRARLDAANNWKAEHPTHAYEAAWHFDYIADVADLLALLDEARLRDGERIRYQGALERIAAGVQDPQAAAELALYGDWPTPSPTDEEMT